MWKLKHRTASIVGLAAAAAIAVPAIAVASYQGQNATAATAAAVAQQATATATPGPGGHPGPHGAWGKRAGAGLDALAQQLGVTTDALKAALQQAKTAVGTPAAGADPQTLRSDFVAALAQALGIDQAKVQAAVGKLPLGRFGDRVDELDRVAQQLGVTTDALKTALQQAKTDVGTPAAGTDPQTLRGDFIAALAKELGIDQATVQAAVGDLHFPFGGPRAGRGVNALDSVATKLGVTTDALKAAIEKARTDVGKPAAGTDPQTYRSDFVAALAKELGIDQAAVQAAIGNGPFGFGGPGGPGHRGRHGFEGGHGFRGGPGGSAPSGTPTPTGAST